MSAMKDMPVSFPGLFGDWELNIDPVAIHIGHGIYWYGIVLAIAMLAGLYLCMKQAKHYGLTEGHFHGYDPLKFPEVFDSITPEDIAGFLKANVTAERMTVSRIVPKA